MKRAIGALIGATTGALIASASLWTTQTQAADCGKVIDCDQASTPYSGNEIFYLLQGGRGKRGVLGDLANFIRSMLPSAPQVGVSVCEYASCSADTTTGSIAAGQTTLTLADAIDFPASCTGGGADQCGILIGGAGAAFAVGQPQSFALASSCTVQTQSGSTVSGSSIIRSVVALQGAAVGNGITGAGIPGGTTITGYNVNTQTISLSAAATATASAVTLTIADPCVSTLKYRIASFNANGGVGAPIAETTITTAPVQPSTWNPVCMTWAAPATGTPSGYAIWKSTDGTTFNFFATANTEGTGSCAVGVSTPAWDIGQPSQTRPWWIPNDPATIPVGGQPEWLATTIAGGGTSTALTLATSASQTVNGAVVVHDDTAAWASWIAALNASAGAQNGFIPGSSTIRLRTGGAITASNVQISAQKGATILPMGAAVGTVLEFDGSGGETSLTPAGNLTEGSSCLPLSSISGLAIGDYMLVQQASPGGPTQVLLYTLYSPIAQLSCEGVATGVRLTDAATVTFTDAAHTETATITGTPAANDTVQVSVTGDYVCSATYTVGAGDTTTTIARGLALAWDAACPSILATATSAVVFLQSPSFMASLTWARVVTLGGGGSEDVILAAGTPYTVQKTPNTLTGVGVSGLKIDGRDAVGPKFSLFPSAVIGVRSNSTSRSTFRDLDFINFNGGAIGFYGTRGRGNLYADIALNNASGGTPNITSYSDFMLVADTKSQVKNIRSSNALSFGPQFQGSSGIIVDGVHQSQAYAGRGIKIGAVTGSQFSNLDSANAVYDNFEFCCGSYRNSVTNIRSTYGYGANPDGIAFVDAWNRFHILTNVQAVGSRYDLVLQPTDLNNTIIGGFLGTGTGFATVYDTSTSSVAYDINGCDKAYNTAPLLSGAMTCQTPVFATGEWTPILAGTTTAGSTTYASQTGTWEQSNQSLTARFVIVTNSALVGMVGNMRVYGLPHAQAAGDALGTCAIGFYSGVTFTGGRTQLTALVLTGAAASVQLYENGSGVAGTALAVGAFADPVTLYGTCSYRRY